MPLWRIPVTWEMCGIVELEGNRLEDVMDKVKHDNDDIGLPEGNYVDGSFDLSNPETEIVRESYNNNQPDKEENDND